MRELVVLSGKGGTGKTSVTASLASLASRALLADADVDAANLSLLLSAERRTEEDFTGGDQPAKDDSLCGECGLCREHCRFGAIGEDLAIDLHACEGCALCSRVCPEGAIRMVPRLSGRVFTADTPYGRLVSAHLTPGEENSGKLVFRVKELARTLAAEEGADLLLVDGPPGTGCPAIAALSGASFALVITEPGVAGKSDLWRILDLASHFGVASAVVVNKWDLAPDATRDIREGCDRRGVPVLGLIPFDAAVVRAIVSGCPPVRFADGPAARALHALWTAVSAAVREEQPVC